MISSIVCSLPIYLVYMMTIKNSIILLVSFVIFVFVIGFDAYRFSYFFWEKKDYFLGQLLPVFIYMVMGFLTCLIFKPVVFNRIFLPLRFAGCIGITTIKSIGIVSIVLMIFVSILSFLGARSGYAYYMTVRQDEDD